MVMTSTRSLALTVATCAIYSCNTQSDVDALKLTVRTPSVQGKLLRALSFCRTRTPKKETDRATTSDSIQKKVPQIQKKVPTIQKKATTSPDDPEESPAVTKVVFDADRYLNQILTSATKDQDGRDTKTTFLTQAELDLFYIIYDAQEDEPADDVLDDELRTYRNKVVMDYPKLFGKDMLSYVKVFKRKLEDYIKNVVKDSSLDQQDLLLELKYTQYVKVGDKLLNVAEGVSMLSKMEEEDIEENGVEVTKILGRVDSLVSISDCITEEDIDNKYYAVGDELTRVAHQLVFQMIKKIAPDVSLDFLISAYTAYTTATSSMH